MKDKRLRKVLGLTEQDGDKVTIAPNSLIHNMLVAIGKLNEKVFPELFEAAKEEPKKDKGKGKSKEKK